MKRQKCPTCGRAAPGPDSKPARDAKIVRMAKAGQSPTSIAAHFGISKQRVSAIVKAAQS